MDATDSPTPTASPSAPEAESPSSVDATGLPEDFVLTPEYVEEEAIRGDIVLRGAVVLLATLFGWTHLTSTATLLRIRTGQELAAQGVLPPGTDAFFSYTAADRAWINLGWLGDLLLAGVYGLGGGALLSVYCGLLSGLAFWLLGRTSIRNAPTWWGSLCLALAVIAVFPLLTPGPTLLTVLGLALVMWILHCGLEASRPRFWWWLVPVMLVWSNVDPRAYLGLVLIVLYSVGHALTPREDGTIAASVFGPAAAAFVAALVNPFGIEVLRSPVVLIRQFYPLWLQHGGADAAAYSYLWRPVFSETTTSDPGWHLMAAGVLAVCVLGALVFNYRRLHWGELLAVLGLNVLSLAAGLDFTAVAVVNAAAANLNGQRWYQASCRQEYTVDRWELLYSRAGRAVTVLALFAAAFWGISGWMTGPSGRRVGFGFSERLQADIDGYRELLGRVGSGEIDDHPFHLTPRQGDLLAWLGRRTFTDSRLMVFAPPGAESLLERQEEIAESLRSPSQPLTTPAEITSWASVWKDALDRYGITHVVIPLDDVAGYGLWVNLASQAMALDSGDVVRFWQSAGITGPAVAMYRLDADAGDVEQMTQFLREHGQSLIVPETFRKDDEKPRTPRGLFPHGPTFYETSLLLPEPVIPNETLVARHYATRLEAAQRSLFETIAYCHQIIRHGRRGLSENPNSVDTYHLLGGAYQRLWDAERAAASNPLAVQAAERRLMQAVFAFHHAAICRPSAPEPHAALSSLYIQHGDYDLALRHLDRVQELTGRYTLLSRDEPGYSASQQQAKRLRGELNEAVQRGREAVEKSQLGGLQSAAGAALQMRCPGYALELLEEDLTLTVGNPSLALQYGRLLLLSGRTSDGFEQIERQLAGVEGTPLSNSVGQQIRPLAALGNLAADDYERAIALWEELGQNDLETILNTYFQSLPAVTMLGEEGDAWPIFQVMTAAESSGRYVPDWELSQWQAAMTELESGQNTKGQKRLEQVLASNPRSLLRPQMSMYLTMLTGQAVAPFLPDEGAAAQRFEDRPPSPSLPVRP